MASEEFGPYILEDVLGRGGMGVVYRAFDTRRDRTVALKRLPRHLAEDETFQARFRRESRMAARLNEPHIIPIHDFGEIDGQLYIDMRLVEGSDLSNLITSEHGLSPAGSVDVVGQIAAALSAAHAAGLVHRDIKPSNVLVTGLSDEADDDTMFAYLVDFGIARAMVGEAGTSLTATTGTVGTLAYMAPERISGASGDSRSDIYSLACVLYECLVGRAPFLGEAFQVMFAHVNSDPPTASTSQRAVSTELDSVIRRGMAKDPDDRYQTTTQFAAAARRALSADSTGGVPRPLPLATPPLTSPRPTTTPPPTTPPPPPTARPVDRTPPPSSSQFGPARHSTSTSGPVQPSTPVPGMIRPADPDASRPTLRTAATPGSPTAPPNMPAPNTPTPPSWTGPAGPARPAGPSSPPSSGPPPPSPPPHARATSSTPPPGPPPGAPRSFADSGPIPPGLPAQRTSGGGGNNNRTLILIAVAAVIVLVVGIVIVVAVRGGGSPQADPTSSATPTTSTQTSPDFPTTSGSAPTATYTSPSAGAGWEPYAQFTELIGATPGDTSTSYLGATCKIQPPDPEITGMIDQIACTKLTGTKVVFYVGRFSSGKAVTTYLDSLVKKTKYNRSYWTIGEQRRGLLVTSPSTVKYADVTSSICQLPTFLVQFYADASAGLTEQQVEDAYWKKSTFPNTTPTICR